MQLKPLRTRSKKTPRINEKTLDTNSDQPIISLEETKNIIKEKLLQDERKIRIRNPKKHVVSEEKWTEGTTRQDIIQQGEKREKEVLMQEENSTNVGN